MPNLATTDDDISVTVVNNDGSEDDVSNDNKCTDNKDNGLCHQRLPGKRDHENLTFTPDE